MSLLPVGFGSQGGAYTIEESLRFNASQSSYLSRTPASAGTSDKKFTYSGWVKRGLLGSIQNLISSPSSGNSDSLRFSAADKLEYIWQDTGAGQVTTTQVFRDPSAWYHIVFAMDTTQVTASNRFKLYVNGVQVTVFDTASYPAQNTVVNNTAAVATKLGQYANATIQNFDGYLTEVNFIDGQALDASSFGEFDSVTGVWKPSEYTGTYGTNGFYLPMQLDNTVEGFNTVTYVGTGSTQRIRGVGFSPDLVWIKKRSATEWHALVNVLSGTGKFLRSDSTDGEITNRPNCLTSFDSDGFTVGNEAVTNQSGQSFVAWCWDAGSSTVSNTDGSITSSVRANPTYGFSVVTYTGDGNLGGTVGHGLGVAPSLIIAKERTAAGNWPVYHSSIGKNGLLILNLTNGTTSSSNYWGSGGVTSTVFGTSTVVGASNGTNRPIVAYCFSEIAGYSKFGSYTGTGASGNTVTTGFKPAFVMIKRTDVAGENWFILDSTRNANNVIANYLRANLSDAEAVAGTPIFNFLSDGFQLTNSAGAYNASGGTYIYMAFKDTREYAYWLDDSGNNNDWQPNGGITTNSTVTDTPTPYADGGNYAVLNPLAKDADVTLSNGNLNFSCTSTGLGGAIGTIAVTSGKWYWEVTVTGGTASSVGIAKLPLSAYNANQTGTYFYLPSGSKRLSPSTDSAYGASYTTNDVIGVALDMDAGTVAFYKNNSSQGTAFSSLSGDFTAWMQDGTSGSASSFVANFGQRPFAYTPPTGFLSLHTGNLPDSAIVDGSEYFNPVLYTGTGSSLTVGGVGFQPDLVWIKDRASGGSNHNLWDLVRGAGQALFSNLTEPELTDSDMTGFVADGFTFSGVAWDSNTSGQSYVSWNWKANGAGVSNTDGSITSTVSANPTAGFSIVTYTGNATNNATVGHGLGALPNMVIVKNRDSALDWGIWHTSLSTGQVLRFSTLAATVPGTAYFQDENNTSSVFALGANDEANGSSNSHVAYCFADVEGYSKFGKYTGNGSTDGPFVYLGFRPAFVMVKRTDAANNWVMFDSSRDTYNAIVNTLSADTANSESAFGAGYNIDFLSNGFKPRNTTGAENASGGTYIYMAFAENPFKNSLAR